MRVLPVIAACALASGVALAGTPTPRIVLGTRIGGASYGERKSQVDAILGRGEPGDGGNPSFYYPRADLIVHYARYARFRDRSRADLVATWSRRYRTRSGVGVGSPLRVLRSRIRVTCTFGADSRHRNECENFPTNSGRSQTWFLIDRSTNRVEEVFLIRRG